MEEDHVWKQQKKKIVVIFILFIFSRCVVTEKSVGIDTSDLLFECINTCQMKTNTMKTIIIVH